MLSRSFDRKWLRTSGIAPAIPAGPKPHNEDEMMVHPEERRKQWRRAMQRRTEQEGMREQRHAPGAPGQISRRGAMREEAPGGEASLSRLRQCGMLQGARLCAQVAVHQVLPPVLRHRRDDDGVDPPPAQEMVRGHMAHVQPEGRHQRMLPAAPDRLQLQDIGADACEDTLRHGQIGVRPACCRLTASRRTTSI